MSATEPTLTPAETAELKRLVQRGKDSHYKRVWRKRKAEKDAKAAISPPPNGYRVPRMPASPQAIRKWLRSGHDAYSGRLIGVLELEQMRKSAAAVGESYKVGSFMKQALAAVEAAKAQTQMAKTLAEFQHGGAAVAWLSRAQSEYQSGPRRPLPSRALGALPPASEPA
jgi:hypothetical protein